MSVVRGFVDETDEASRLKCFYTDLKLLHPSALTLQNTESASHRRFELCISAVALASSVYCIYEYKA